ncbi:NUDIX hydrolase [Leekyejoonella antrihumi]|uniref:GNAT family N-acetyltransferase n=1 Tax=Leekyejoonella antrihumi TaxID=1660198 RepID=A0A563E5X4_9MICO|nr:GNAT family N-acetyltransferase [Leekyejoonella antrihumi]TWP37940.1 GNAT family N-acetyltransferase [Leekyejoonella antrihumi]
MPSAAVPTLTLRATSAADDTEGRRAAAFVIEADGVEVGTVELRHVPGRESTGQLTWALGREHRGKGYGHQGVRMLIDRAFNDLGIHRVEAYVEVGDRTSVRLASRAGMRKEGLIREYAAGRDVVLMARVVGDPGAATHEAFIAGLNSGLPTKRAIAQALIRDEAGRVLACELVYKHYWDLPGGVVDPHESPAQAVVREIAEELGVDAVIRELAVVSWLPPWQGWDDATLFLFEATVSAQQLSEAVLQPREIKALHWCDEREFADHAADYTTRLVRRAVQQLDEGVGTAYLEDGRDPDW